MTWYEALKVKSPQAIKVLPETIKSVPGTDALRYPAYSNYSFDNISEITIGDNNGVLVKDAGDVFIPLNEDILLYIKLDPSAYFSNPIVNAIISSVKVKR